MHLMSVMHERNSLSSVRVVVKLFLTFKETISKVINPYSLCVIELTAVVLV